MVTCQHRIRHKSGKVRRSESDILTTELCRRVSQGMLKIMFLMGTSGEKGAVVESQRALRRPDSPPVIMQYVHTV